MVNKYECKTSMHNVTDQKWASFNPLSHKLKYDQHDDKTKLEFCTSKTYSKLLYWYHIGYACFEKCFKLGPNQTPGPLNEAKNFQQNTGCILEKNLKLI